MLSRASSEAGNRLRRSKSSSTVYQRHRTNDLENNKVDPEVAHQQAVVAATTAYYRSQTCEPSTGSPTRRPAISRRQSNTSRLSGGPSLLNRGPSLRFAESTKPSLRSKSSFRHSMGSRPIPGPDECSNSRFSVDLSKSENENAHPVSMDGGHFRRHSSITTSNRYIRKARSMYHLTGSQAPILSKTTSPVTIATSNRKTYIDSDASLLTQSQFPSPSRAPPRLPTGLLPTENSAILGSDASFQDSPRDKSMDWSFLGHFKKRQDRGKNTPQASTVTYDSIVPTQEQSYDGLSTSEGPGAPARSISMSFKSKFKRVFRKSSNASSSFPPQHVEASRAYFGNNMSDQPSIPTNDEFTDTDVLEGTMSCTPTHSVQGSENPDQQSKSRVTSWGNSSAGNTVASEFIGTNLTPKGQFTWADNAENNEDMSNSNSRHAFKDPIPTQTESGQAATPVDSRRVYSALMKVIDKKQTRNSSEAGPTEIGKTSALDTLPSQTRRSSIISGISNFTRNTIRTVSSEETNSGSKHNTIRAKMRPRSHRRSSKSSALDLDTPQSDIHGDKSHDNAQGPIEDGPESTHPQIATLPTTDTIANRVDKSNNRWKSSLEEGRSIYFESLEATSAYCPINIPKNRARIKAIQEEASSYKGTNEELVSSIMQPSRVLSPSIYSRDSDGQSVVRMDCESPVPGLGEGDMGTAVIIESHPIACYPVGTPQAQRGLHSVRSSRDWTAWLSKEVADLEAPPNGDINNIDAYVHSKSGHHREHAQIIEEDDRNFTPQERPRSRAIRFLQPKAESKTHSRPDTEDAASIMSGPTTGCASIFRKLSPDERPHSRGGGEDTENGSGQGKRPTNKLRRSRLDEKTRPNSRMNDRFPMIDTGRRWGNQNGPNEQNTSPDDVGEMHKNIWKENLAPKHLLAPRLVRSGLGGLKESSRSTSSLAHYTTTAEDANSLVFPRTPSPNRRRRGASAMSHRTKSAIELREHFSTPETPRDIKRKPVTGRALEGDTLRMILEGPYATRTPPPRFGKENSPARNISAHDFAHETGWRNISANSTPTAGQRMADQFLHARSMGQTLNFPTGSPRSRAFL